MKSYCTICYFEVIINITNQSFQTLTPLLSPDKNKVYLDFYETVAEVNGDSVHKYCVTSFYSLERTSLECL